MKILIRSSVDLAQPRSLWSNAYLRNSREIIHQKISRLQNKLTKLRQQLKNLENAP